MDSSHHHKRRLLHDRTVKQDFDLLGGSEDTEEATAQVSPLNSLFSGLVSGEFKPFCKLNEQSQQG